MGDFWIPNHSILTMLENLIKTFFKIKASTYIHFVNIIFDMTIKDSQIKISGRHKKPISCSPSVAHLMLEPWISHFFTFKLCKSSHYVI